MRKIKRFTSLLGFFLFLFTFSCKDEELNSLMDEYCDCINKYEGDELGRNTCITLIDSIQKKYKNQPRKLNKVIEKAGSCN